MADLIDDLIPKNNATKLDQTWNTLGNLGMSTPTNMSVDPNVQSKIDQFNQMISGSSRIQNKTSASSSEPTLSPESIDATFESLNSLEGWIDNPMTDFRNSTYKLRFFVTEDAPLNKANFNSYASYTKALSEMKSTTIFESGVTGMSIIDLEITTIVAHTPNARSLAPTKMRMSVKEPMGISLLDYLVGAAKELRIKNYSKVPYYLEISFQGYNEDGTFNRNLCSNFKNKGKWLYAVAMTNIETTFTQEGSVYHIDLFVCEEVDMNGNDYSLPFTITPSASTVGGMLDALSENLNKAYEEMYQTPNYRTFKFNLQKFVYDNQEFDPHSFLITSSTEEDLNYARHLSMDIDGVAKGTFGRGLKIHDLVEMLLANSEASQQLGKAVMTQSNLDDGSTEVKDSVVFRVVPSIHYGDYNYVLQNYNIEYTFNIVPYFTQTPILSTYQLDLSRDPAAQARNLQRLRRQGYLAKRYDYLYTGLNTEVINIDISTNTNWSTLLPRVAGFGVSIESTAIGAKFRSREEITRDVNEYARAERDRREMESLNTRITEINERIGESDDQDAISRLEQQRVVLERELGRYVEREEEIAKTISLYARSGEEMEEYNRSESERIGRPNKERTTVKYAEELKEDDRMLDIPSPMPVTIMQSNADTRFTQSGVLPDKYHRDRSIYGAIMDQLYETNGSAMQEITMDIIGDPYWLGSANTERSFETLKAADPITGQVKMKTGMSTDPTRIYIDDGDALFLVRFKYPQGFGEDSNNVVFNTNDMFTGVYKATSITHSFTNGVFKQTVNGIRLPLIQVLGALGNTTDLEGKKI